MKFIEGAKVRRLVRAFQPAPIVAEKLEKIPEAADFAFSVGYLQANEI